jgi:membrane associated rhomboid family serine protease
MFRSIYDDVRRGLQTGNMVNRLIIINVIIYVVVALLFAFSHTIRFDKFLTDHLAISNDWKTLLYNPWTVLTHMFMHAGFGHILWNMVGLNLFGSIVGDLIGDRRILPMYLFGGIFGAIFFILATLLMGHISTAMGASAAVMALAVTAGLIAPDYGIRLLLIGDVKLKYIVFVFIFFDIIGTQSGINSGGHFGHLGGALAGFLFFSLYNKGVDILLPLERLINFIQNLFVTTSRSSAPYRPVMKVEYGSGNSSKKSSTLPSISKQERVDLILDKINEKGYDNLSSEEKEFLKNASKE